ncbi:hypothetical protein K1719_000491 [Acacia pycnantha]|nr:hypothetical protein K1719_000491 [Acacia pycnantha]
MNNQKNMVLAQGPEDPNQNTNTSIQQCNLTPSSDLKPVVGSIKTFLGRPWKEYSRTVVMQSFLSTHIDPAGWAPWDDKQSILKNLYYGDWRVQKQRTWCSFKMALGLRTLVLPPLKGSFKVALGIAVFWNHTF